MRKSLFVLSVLMCLLNCGFISPESENNFAGENAADKAYLDSLRVITSEYFYKHYFLHPKSRGGYGATDLNEVRKSKKMVSSSPKISASRDSALRQQMGEQKYAEYREGVARIQKFVDFVESKLTPERMEIVAQMRRLASEHSYVNDKRAIEIRISKEQALESGISALAYDNYAEGVKRINKHHVAGENEEMQFWSYQIFFDDNINDSDRDIVISYERK